MITTAWPESGWKNKGGCKKSCANSLRFWDYITCNLLKLLAENTFSAWDVLWSKFCGRYESKALDENHHYTTLKPQPLPKPGKRKRRTAKKLSFARPGISCALLSPSGGVSFLPPCTQNTELATACFVQNLLLSKTLGNEWLKASQQVKAPTEPSQHTWVQRIPAE